MSYSYEVLICVVAQVHFFFSLQDKHNKHMLGIMFLQKEQQNSKRVKRMNYNLFKCVLIFKCTSISF